jgi:hypothetical protein
MIEQFLKYVLGEARLIAATPAIFIAAVLVVGVIIWTLLSWRYGGIIESKDSIIALYKERLNGATPDEAKAKIDALERRVKLTIGSDWVSLSSSEIAKLSAEVASLPKRRIQVMYSNAFGKDLAQSIADAFTRGGWNDMHFSEGGGLGVGVSTGRGNGMAFDLKRAIESATRLKVGSIGENEKDTPGIVFVSVGINPD